MRTDKIDNDHLITPGRFKNEAPGLFWISILFIPFLLIAAYIAWPEIMILEYFANIAALLSGAFFLSITSGEISRTSRGTLPLTVIFIVVITGVLLFSVYGWASTFLLLVGYGLICIAAAIMRRARN